MYVATFDTNFSVASKEIVGIHPCNQICGAIQLLISIMLAPFLYCMQQESIAILLCVSICCMASKLCLQWKSSENIGYPKNKHMSLLGMLYIYPMSYST